MAFQPGQRVVCVVGRFRFRWRDIFGAMLEGALFGSGFWAVDPQRGGLYMVAGSQVMFGRQFLKISGFANWYEARGFRPVVDDQMQRLAEIAANPLPVHVREELARQQAGYRSIGFGDAS